MKRKWKRAIERFLKVVSAYRAETDDMIATLRLRCDLERARADLARQGRVQGEMLTTELGRAGQIPESPQPAGCTCHGCSYVACKVCAGVGTF